MEDNLANNTALGNEEKKKLLVKRLVLLIAAVVMLVITIFAFSKAWFTSNTDVSAEGMSVQAGDTLFSIATKGDDPRNSDVFAEIDATAYAEGTQTNFTDVDGDYYISDTNTLVLRATSDNEATVEPGSSGTVEFYVIPKTSGDLTINITLEVIPYVYDETAEKYTKASESNDNTVKLAGGYLTGHILFFQTKESGKTYQYSGFINDGTAGSITLENYILKNLTKDTPQQVKLYWTWPDTIGNLAATYSCFIDGSTSVVDKSKTDGNSDLGKVRTYLTNNVSKVFSTTERITEDTITGIDGGYNTDPTNGDATYYELLTTAYNNADSLIGKNINCFMIEVTVSEGGDS